MNIRLAKSEATWLERRSWAQHTTKSEVLREILTEYTRDPTPLASAFVDRINRALVLKEGRVPEEKVQFAPVLPDDIKDALDTLSTQTGASIEALVSLMIGGHMIRTAKEAECQGQ